MLLIWPLQDTKEAEKRSASGLIPYNNSQGFIQHEIVLEIPPEASSTLLGLLATNLEISRAFQQLLLAI